MVNSSSQHLPTTFITSDKEEIRMRHISLSVLSWCIIFYSVFLPVDLPNHLLDKLESSIRHLVD